MHYCAMPSPRPQKTRVEMRELYARLDRATTDESVWIETTPTVSVYGPVTKRTLRILYFDPSRISKVEADELAIAEAARCHRNVGAQPQSPAMRQWLVKAPWDPKAAESLFEKALQANVIHFHADLKRQGMNPYCHNPKAIDEFDAYLLEGAHSRTI
jgi:hypothetical protein